MPRHLLERAAEAVTAHLPIRTVVGAVSLIVGSAEPDSWRGVAEFPLGDGARPG